MLLAISADIADHSPFHLGIYDAAYFAALKGLDMSDFPSLTQMGIKNPNQITRHTSYVWNHIGHLRIVYNR